MWKKVMIAAVAIILAVVVVKGTWIGSHFRMWGKKAGNWVKNQVKIESEINRLRHEVESLEREDRVALDLVARQRLEVKEAEEKFNKDKTDLTRLFKRITDLRAALKGPESEVQNVSYNGISYSRADVENQINVDFDRYKPLKGSVAAQEKGLVAIRKALAQNESKLFSGKQRRQEMLTQLQELQNDLTELRQAQAQSNSATVMDDSNYSRVQRDIKALRHRLAVEKEKLKVEGTLGGGPIEQAETNREQKQAREKEIEAEFGQARAPQLNK